jgi:hypothetical protein
LPALVEDSWASAPRQPATCPRSRWQREQPRRPPRLCSARPTARGRGPWNDWQRPCGRPGDPKRRGRKRCRIPPRRREDGPKLGPRLEPDAAREGTRNDYEQNAEKIDSTRRPTQADTWDTHGSRLPGKLCRLREVCDGRVTWAVRSEWPDYAIEQGCSAGESYSVEPGICSWDVRMPEFWVRWRF